MLTPSTAKHLLTQINQLNQSSLYRDLQAVKQYAALVWKVLNTNVI